MFFDTGDLRNDEIFLKLVKAEKSKSKQRWAPCYLFKICLSDGGAEIGLCDFRIGNTEKLYFGGNIGYRVYEPYRGFHYAAKACLLLFELAKKHKMPYLYITCNPDNFASRRTCEYAGATLESIIDLPEDNDMYLIGERKKCIYKVTFSERDRRKQD